MVGLILLLWAWALIAPIFGILAYWRKRTADSELAVLRRQIDAMRAELDTVQGRRPPGPAADRGDAAAETLPPEPSPRPAPDTAESPQTAQPIRHNVPWATFRGADAPPVEEAPPAGASPDIPEPPPTDAAPEPEDTAAETTAGGGSDSAGQDTPVPAPPEQPSERPPRERAPAPPRIPLAARLRVLEEQLTARWFVWVGAAALALGGAFFVKYTIDEGWFGPIPRIAVGVICGIGLAVFGEAMRRRQAPAPDSDDPRVDYVPSALAASGIAVVFASLYAAYALYGLMPPVVTFGLLAVTAGAAMALSLVHGPLVAAVGLVGGYLTPALVSTGSHSAVALFGYLSVISAGGFGVTWRTGAVWLAVCTIAGAVAWPLLWFLALWSPADTPILAAYILALCALQVPTIWLENTHLAPGSPAAISRLRLTYASAIAMVALAFVLVRMDRYEPVSLVTLAVLCGGLMYLGRRRGSLDLFGVIAAAGPVATVAVWHVAIIMTPTDLARRMLSKSGLSFDPSAVLPPSVAAYAAWVAAFALLIGGGGFLALWRSRRPIVWAGISTATPLALFGFAYWRIVGIERDFVWSLVALGIAAAMTAAAYAVERRRDDAGMRAALGIYIAAAFAFIGLALAILLRDAWLTMALALQLPILAWIGERLELRIMRRLAHVAAVVVAARLALNPWILDYDSGAVLGKWWIVYGYGVPIACFAYAARRFRKAANDSLVATLESGTLIFSVMLVTFSIRNLVAGQIDARHYSALEMTLHSASWLAMAWSLFRADAKSPSPFRRYAAIVLSGVAVAQVIVGHLVVSNPLAHTIAVGDTLVLNMLVLYYLVPALFVYLLSRQYRRLGFAPVASAAEALATLLAVVFVSLEIHHGFHGTYLDTLSYSVAEMATQTLAWLVMALAMTWVRARWPDAIEHRVEVALAGLATAQILVGHLVLANPVIAHVAVGTTLIANLLVLLYLLPAVAFYLIAAVCRGIEQRLTAYAAQAVALCLGVVFLSLEIRQAFHGDYLDDRGYGAVEMSVLTLLWLGLAWGLLKRDPEAAHPVHRYGAMALTAAGAAQIVLGHLLMLNPLLSPVEVGTWPVFNTLALLYLAPTAMAYVLAGPLRKFAVPAVNQAAAAMLLVLPFVFVTLEIRHAFQGTILVLGPTTNAEWYAYSAVWLLFGAALLALAIWRGSAQLRYASMALVCVTITKVFLFDLSFVTGLLRAASFVGLGASLIAIGYVYRRWALTEPVVEKPLDEG